MHVPSCILLTVFAFLSFSLRIMTVEIYDLWQYLPALSETWHFHDIKDLKCCGLRGPLLM